MKIKYHSLEFGRYSLLALFFFGAHLGSLAQEPPVTARLQGTVTKGGAPVASLKIDASLQDGSDPLQVMTDANGRFDFGVGVGNWNLWLDSSSASAENFVGAGLSEPVANNHTVPSLGILNANNYSLFFAPAPNGNVYATAGLTANAVYVINPDGVARTFISGAGLNGPYGIAVDGTGNIFVANNGNGTIAKFDANGGFLQIFATGLSYCQGIKFDAGGNLYVATSDLPNYSNGQIIKITPNGTQSQFATVEDPINLIFDSNGIMYVASSQSNNNPNGEIIKIAPDGAKSVLTDALIEPWGLAFDADGNLLVSDVVMQSLCLVNPSGAVTNLWAVFPGNAHLRDLIFNPEGVLYLQTTPTAIIYTPNYNGTQTNLSLPVQTGTGVINGTVSDAAGDVFAAESVTAQATIAGVSYSASATTDINGNYSFPIINGTWSVRVADGNGLIFSPQSVPANSSTTANFTFQPISSQPATQTVIAGQGANFTVGANTLATGALQWQISTDSGSSWSNLHDTGTYSGSASNQLLVNDTLSAMTGYQYRCVVSYLVNGQTVSTDSASATITVETPFEAWQQSTFTQGELSNPAVSGPLATPASDGISNLEKYAFNLNPFADGHAGLPEPAMVNGLLTLTFQALPSDLAYTVQASTDLQNWSANGVTITTNGSLVTATYDLTGHPLAFLRIQIGQNN